MRALTRLTRLIAIVVLISVVPVPARAGVGVTIRAIDNRFNPDIIYGLTTSPDDPAGNHPIRWRNDGENDHQVIEHPDQEGIKLRTRLLSPGETSRAIELKIAAVWKYICRQHGVDMDGFLKVRPAIYKQADPGDYQVTQGPRGQAILRLANAALPENYALDVQRRRGEGPWTTIRSHIRARTLTLSPNDPGAYQFRSRIHHITSGSQTAWSPPSKILRVTNPS